MKIERYRVLMERYAATAVFTCAAVLAAFLCAAKCCAAADTHLLPQKPDLNVTYISLRPLYAGYYLDYPNDIPTFWVVDEKAPDGKREVSREEYQKLIKFQHAAGDEVTFTAHIRNNGFVPSPETDYRLYIDNEEVGQGNIEALEPDEEATVEYKWAYLEGRHTFSCEVDIDNNVDEICEMNNRLTDPTHGIGLTIRAYTKEHYRAFRSTPNIWGSYSFEDWCQAHIQEWRKAFREAIYPATPEGVLRGIRFDGIYTALEDPGVEQYRIDVADSLARTGRDYQGPEFKAHRADPIAWRIAPKIEQIPEYATKIDRGLIHELCHQCGIIDIYQIGIGLEHNLVPDPNGHFSWATMGSYRQHNDLMAVFGPTEGVPQKGLFREHTAAAFNSEMNKPRWGFGLYLFDVPKHNIVEVLDNRGQPIPGAKIKLYQQEIYTHIIGTIPPKIGVTDSEGTWDIGPRPIDKVHVVGSNALMLLDIQAYHQWEQHYLVLTEMNIAYWRGDKESHVYTIETGIAPPGSVPAPKNATIEPLSAEKGVLTWEYPEDVRNVQKFIVLKRSDRFGTVYEPPFEEIVAEVYAIERSAEVDIKSNTRVFFTVVAVDQMGDRSGYSDLVVYPNDQILPETSRICGIVYTPDGSFLGVNTDVATLYGLDSRGGRLNFGTNIKLPARYNAKDKVGPIVSDSKGVLYVPYAEGGFVYRVDARKATLLGNLECSAFEAPCGIAIDSRQNLYVTDLGSRKVNIITRRGKLLGSIDGKDESGDELFKAPTRVYVDKKGLVYVVDCVLNEQDWRLSPGSVHVFGKKPGAKWDYEHKLTIDGLVWPQGIVVDDEGRIYVGVSSGLEVYDPTGEKIATWGGKPYGNRGGAQTIYAMTWAPDGCLVVSQGLTLQTVIRVTSDEIFKE
jgi:hypothetical protein